MQTESISTPTTAMATSDRDARRRKSRGRSGARVVCQRRQENESNGPRRVESEHTGSAAGARDTRGGGMMNVEGAYHLGFGALACARHWPELRRKLYWRFPCARQRTRKWYSKIGVGKGIFCRTGFSPLKGFCGIFSRPKVAFRIAYGWSKCTRPSQACSAQVGGSKSVPESAHESKKGIVRGELKAAHVRALPAIFPMTPSDQDGHGGSSCSASRSTRNSIVSALPVSTFAHETVRHVASSALK